MTNKSFQSLLLFKLQMINQYRLNNFKLLRDPRNKAMLDKLGAKENFETKKNNLVMLNIIVIVVLFSLFSFSTGYSLGHLGLADLIPAYAAASCAIASLAFTLLKTNGYLFGFRDYDLLMSLPVPISSVVASRFLLVYFTNLVFSFFLVLPMAAAHIIFVKPGVIIYLFWLIGIFTTPLIPTAIGVLLGSIVMAVATRSRHTKTVSSILAILLIMATLVLSMFSGELAVDLEESGDFAGMGTFIYDQICSLYPLADMFNKSFKSGGFIYFLLFIGLSIAVYLIMLLLISTKYKAINTALAGQIKRTDFELNQRLLSASPLKALYRKEWKRFLSCTVYLTNAGIGALMTLMFGLALAILGPDQAEAYLGVEGIGDTMNRLIPYLLAIMLSISCTSCSSLSLEGKNLWIIKSCPLSPRTIFDSKILVNLTLTVPVAVICGLLISIRLKAGLADTFIIFMIPLTSTIFAAVWGMYINIKMPRYEWESEIQIVKQSAASMIGMLGSAGIILVLTLIAFIPFGLHSVIIPIITIIGLCTATAILYQKVCRSEI
ncbi:MAG: hypothetical protein FWC09_08485 [Lachnospiraceae bacterium]|nr:hypothetical protein [Lachnospiraceae bacterium]